MQFRRRRQVMATGVAVAGMAVLLAACSSNSNPPSSGGSSSGGTSLPGHAERERIDSSS